MSTTFQNKLPKVYDLVAKKPVARFFYKGHHSHPIRRTVAIIAETTGLIIGYEFREGSKVRSVEEALDKIKSYRKDKIAKWGDYQRLRMSTRTFLKSPDLSTLERFSIRSMFTQGA